MRYLFLAVIFACISMQASALVVEPEQKPVVSKSTTSKIVNAPSRQHAQRTQKITQTKAPPSEESVRFYQAALNENFDMMRLYISKGANVDCTNCGRHQGISALMELSGHNGYHDKSEVIKFLIFNGANVNQQSSSGQTALMYAASACNANHMMLLGDNGAVASIADQNGLDPLVYLLGAGYCEKRLQLFKYLTAKGAQINRQDRMGETPLMRAAQRCWVEVTQLFLTLGANPNIKTNLGETALTLAEKSAINTYQGSECNQTYSMLSEPERYMSESSSKPAVAVVPLPNNMSPSNNTGAMRSVYGAYVGNYVGNYSGDDNGTFQVTVEQDGNIKLVGKSLHNNQSFTGNGKMNNDGSLGISFGNISTGATFQGSINPKTGALYGTWKNGDQIGNFSGSRQTTQAQAANPVEAIGGLLNVLNKALAK